MAATPLTVRRSTIRPPARSAHSFIRLVRRHTAALFNDGLSEASAGIHEAAACALLRQGHRLPSASRRDLRSAFTLFNHYRQYAEALNPHHPDFVLEIAYYFEYYGQVARDAQLTFLVESIAHDLGTLAQHAWEGRAKLSLFLEQRCTMHSKLLLL